MNELRKAACVLMLAALFLADYHGMAVGGILTVYFWDRIPTFTYEVMLDLFATRFRWHTQLRWQSTARVAHKRFVEWRMK